MQTQLARFLRSEFPQHLFSFKLISNIYPVIWTNKVTTSSFVYSPEQSGNFHLFYLGFHFFKFQPEAKYNWKLVSISLLQRSRIIQIYSNKSMQPLSKAFLHLKGKKKKKKLYSSLSLCSLHKMSSAFRTLTLMFFVLFLQFKISTFITFSTPKTGSFSLERCRNQYFCTITGILSLKSLLFKTKKQSPLPTMVFAALYFSVL